MTEKSDLVAQELLRRLAAMPDGMPYQAVHGAERVPEFTGALGFGVSRDDIQAAAWALVARRLAFVDLAHGDRAGFMRFKVTAWGTEAALAASDYNPFAASIYMHRIREDIELISGETCNYLVEALAAFDGGLFLATTVMLGAAAECAFLEMLECFVRYLPAAERADFTKSTDRAPISVKIREFRTRLDRPELKELRELREDSATIFDAVQSVIRKNRNEAGHPTGRRFGRDECQAALFVAPSYLGRMCALKRYFRDRQASS